MEPTLQQWLDILGQGGKAALVLIVEALTEAWLAFVDEILDVLENMLSEIYEQLTYEALG